MRVAALAFLLLTSVALGQGSASSRDRQLFRVRPVRGVPLSLRQPFPVIVDVDNTRQQLTANLELSFPGKSPSDRTIREISVGKGTFRFFMYPVLPANWPTRMIFQARDRAGRIMREREIFLPVNRRRAYELGPRDVSILLLMNPRSRQNRLPAFRSEQAPDVMRQLAAGAASLDLADNDGLDVVQKMLEDKKFDQAAQNMVALWNASDVDQRAQLRTFLRRIFEQGERTDAKGANLAGELPQWRRTGSAFLAATADLPDNILGYTLIDTIVWDGTRDAPNATQRQALDLWIRRGGHLLLMPAVGATRLKSPLPDAVPNLSLSFVLDKKRVEAKEWPLPIDDIYGVREYGSGSIGYLGMHWVNIHNLPKAKLAAAFGLPSPRKVSRKTWFTLQVVAGAQLSSDGDMGDGNPHFPPYRGVIKNRQLSSDIEESLAENLRHDLGFKQMDSTPIVIMAIVYILCITFVDYLLLRRLKKLRFTWISLPILILGFSIYSYRTFHHGKLGEARRQEHVIRDRLPRTSLETAYCAIRQPGSEPSTISATEGSIAWGWLPKQKGSNGKQVSVADAPETVLSHRLSPSGDTITIPGIVGSARYFREWRLLKPTPTFTVESLEPQQSSIGGVLKLTKMIKMVEVYVWHNGRLRQLSWRSTPARVFLEPQQEVQLTRDGVATKKAITAAAVYDLNIAYYASRCPLPVHFRGPQTDALRLIRAAGGRKWIMLATYREAIDMPTWSATRLVCERLVLDAEATDNDSREDTYLDDEPIEGEEAW